MRKTPNWCRGPVGENRSSWDDSQEPSRNKKFERGPEPSPQKMRVPPLDADTECTRFCKTCSRETDLDLDRTCRDRAREPLFAAGQDSHHRSPGMSPSLGPEKELLDLFEIEVSLRPSNQEGLMCVYRGLAIAQEKEPFPCTLDAPGLKYTSKCVSA